MQSFGGENCGTETTEETSHRWEDIITIDLQEVGCGGMEWIELT